MSRSDSIYFEYLTHLTLDDLDLDLGEALLQCGASGDQSESVNCVIAQFDISGDVDECRGILSAYGAWDDDELADHAENLRRLVWIAGGDLADQGEFGC